MSSIKSTNNQQSPTVTTANSANTIHTSNASLTTNSEIELPQKSLNLRGARRALPKLYDAIKSNQNLGFFRLWWHLGSISEKEITTALNKLSSDQKLIALKEIAENISNSPQTIRDDLVKFTQNYILDNLQELLGYNKKEDKKETNITQNRDMLIDIVNKLPYDEKFQTSLEALVPVIVEILELKKSKQYSIETELEIYKQALQSYEGSEYFSVFEKFVIDFFVEKYGDKGEATILENAWKFPPSDLQAKMIAACLNQPLFDRASNAKNLTLLVNDVGERTYKYEGNMEPVIWRSTYAQLASLDSFRNAVNNPALFDKGQQNHGQSFKEFYSLLQTTQFFKDAIDRADIKEISLGKYTWKWQEDSTNEQRTEDLLDTILKFCSNGKKNPTQEDYEKAGKFAEKFFLNQNCSGNNSALPNTVNTTINTAIRKNDSLPVLLTNNTTNNKTGKMFSIVTENRELISTEYLYFDKDDPLYRDDPDYQSKLAILSESFSPDEYPRADKSFMIFCRTTRIDLNQENPEEIDINNDENSSIFFIAGAP